MATPRVRPRLRGTRGATMVEAAFITPLFVLLVFGIMEWGYGFLDRLAVKNTSLVGARVASSEGYNGTADYTILQAARKASGAMRATDVELIVVYKASGFAAGVPSGCLTTSVTSVCNRYTGADFAQPPSKFGCGVSAIDGAWCPTIRKYAVTGVNGPPDYVGVYVQGRHNNLTGLFGSGYTFKSDTVLRIEPLRLV